MNLDLTVLVDFVVQYEAKIFVGLAILALVVYSALYINILIKSGKNDVLSFAESLAEIPSGTLVNRFNALKESLKKSQNTKLNEDREELLMDIANEIHYRNTLQD